MSEKVEDRTQGQGRTFPCDSCGADLVFHPGVQSLHCPYCGDTQELAPEEQQVAEQDLVAMLRKLREQRAREAADEQGFKEVVCDGCGATVRFQGTLTSNDCSYCGARLQLEKVHEAGHRVPVDGVLPFRIERKDARQRIKRWVGSRWFAPNAFRRKGVDGKFEGVYTPYWTYDAQTDTRYTGMRGEHYWVTVGSGKKRRRVRKTRWYPASGRFQHAFDDLLVVAAHGIDEKRLNKLAPWPLQDCRPFSPELLAGFLSRTYDVELEQGFAIARQTMEAELRALTRRHIGGDTQRISSIDTAYDGLTYKHLLLPVWLMAYRFKNKAYQVMVNAGTGEVQGQRPYSWVKITLAVLAAALATGIIAVVRSMG